MKSLKKNVLILTISSFFLASCGQTVPIKENPQPEPESHEELPEIPDKPEEKEVDPECEHKYVEKKIEPTCTELGYTLKTCEKCGSTIKDNYVAALDHDYKYNAGKEATFDNEGYVSHYSCRRCDALFDAGKYPKTREEIYYSLDIFKYKDSRNPVLSVHGSLEYSYSKEEVLAIKEEIATEINKLKASDSSVTVNELSKLINKSSSSIDKLGKASEKTGLIADIYNRPADYELYTEINTSYIEIVKLYYGLWAAIGRSNFKTYFYSGYSNAQILQYVEYYESYAYSDNSELEMDKIISDYKAGKLDEYTAISSYVKAANKYAKQYSYSDYATFSYKEVYGREYTTTDTSSLTSYMNNIIVPLYKKALNSLYDFSEIANTHTILGERYYEAILYSTEIENYFFGTQLDRLTSYAEFLGGNYLKNYKSFFESGEYYFSNIDNENITGYCSYSTDGKPYMFLGKNYQSATTFIHEFGHYNSFIEFQNLDSYDLAEIQSQGNEMLYYSYLSYANLIDEYTSKYFLANQLAGILSTIIYGYTINELEKYAYSNENFTKSELENKWIEIGSSIGLDFSDSRYKDYMYAVLINYHCYYISYGVSAIASLEIFAESLKDIESAKAMYLSIVKRDSKNESFSESLANANIYDVFSSKAFSLISGLESIL